MQPPLPTASTPRPGPTGRIALSPQTEEMVYQTATIAAALLLLVSLGAF